MTGRTPPAVLRAGLACAALLGAALAAPSRALAHGGVPVRIVADQRAGPYLVSVWAAPDVGMGMVYVVYRAAAGGAFVALTAVHVGVAPTSGRLTEARYDARPDPVRRGARFVAHVALDRGEEWRVRVVTEGPAGGSEVTARVRATAAEMPGPVGFLFYAAPFLLVAGLRWRAAIARRQAVAPRGALATS